MGDGVGNEVRPEGGRRDVPMLALGAETSGAVVLSVHMRECAAKACYWGARVFTRPDKE